MNLRIISGKYGGRVIKAPDGRVTHPMSDRVRGSLFNIIGGVVQGAEVLDIFAGSGSLGLEALSRGASHATFVERDLAASKILSENINTLGVNSSATVVRIGASTWISKNQGILDSHKTSHRPDTFSTESEAVLSERGEPIGSSNEEKQILDGDGVSGDAGILRESSKLYDIIFVDPPYDNMQFSTVSCLSRLLKLNGFMILSYPGKGEVPLLNEVVVVDNRSYGNAANLAFYQRK